MELSFEMRENVCVVEVNGGLTLNDIKEFKKEFLNYSEQTVNFVFCIKSAQCFDDMISPLVACLKYVSEKDGDIRLANLDEKARMVCEITKAYKIYEIFDDVDEAVKSYQND